MTGIDFLFLSQCTSEAVGELCALVAERLGPTALHTGTRLETRHAGPFVVWPGPTYDNRSYVSRIASWTRYLADATAVSLRVIREGSRPVLVVASNPPMLPLLGLLCKRRHDVPYLVRILDVYPDALVSHGLVGARSPVVRAWSAANRAALDGADHVVTLGPVMACNLGRQMSDPGRIEVIPDWIDTDRVRPLPKHENPFAIAQGLVDRFTVLYSGNMGLTHDLDTVLGAAELLRDDPRIVFVFIGGGARRGEIERAGARLPNLRVLPLQPAGRVGESMAAADVALVTLARGAEGVSMPSKAYQMMAAGAALLGVSHGDSDLRRLIEEHACGVHVGVGDVPAARDAILALCTDPERLARCRRNARAAAEHAFSKRRWTERYVSLLAALRDRVRQKNSGG